MQHTLNPAPNRAPSPNSQFIILNAPPSRASLHPVAPTRAPHGARLRARLRLTGLLLMALPAIACTQVSGDVTAILDPTTPTGLITRITGGQEPAIIMFATASAQPGAFGGRAGADALCVGSKGSAGRACTSVHALISFSGDTIASMRTDPAYAIPDLPLKSPTGVTIGNNWVDLLDSSIPQSLDASGVTSGYNYWTFSNADGTLNAANCDGGTNAAVGGHYGNPASPTDSWLNGGSTGCGTNYPLLCICY